MIPNSVTGIGEWAFSDCASLTNVTIPDAVTNIADYAFFDCQSLSTIVIPDGVTSIGLYAFWSCYGLTTIAIPASVTSIGDRIFYDCTSLSEITVDPLNPAYSSLAGVLFDKSRNTLIFCPEGKAGAYTVPNSVTNIGDGAFYDCSGLTGVTLPDGIVRIGDSAFFDCFRMASAAIPQSVTSIGEYAFNDCASLTSVTIPNGVTNIADSAFYYCRSLASVYFVGNAPNPSTDSSVFSGDDKAVVYYLPGTTGWGTTFDGLPTVLWNPQVQTGNASFGVRTNQFGFNITGTSNLVVVVEASTNLVTWTPLATNTLTSGSANYSDPQWTNYPTRFYRLRWP